MKRRLPAIPAIVILITLSVLGILFIQTQWIRSASAVRQDQYRATVDRTLAAVRTDLHNTFLQKSAYDDFFIGQMQELILAERYSTEIFLPREVRGTLERHLREAGINHPFEFSVVRNGDTARPLMATRAFSTPAAGADPYAGAYAIRVTPNRSRFEEVLYLTIQGPRLARGLGWMIGASFLLTGIVIAAFYLTVRTLLSQKKLNEIKSDFINNMTHEFKTPLATISLAVDALNNEKVVGQPEKTRYYTGMIKEENKRMNKQVNTILQAARLERDEIKLALQPIDLHALIRKVAETLILQIEERQGALELDLQATQPVVRADEVHLSNIVFNLLDNAIKYSTPGEAPRICLSTAVGPRGLLAMRVKDNGIGMTKETAARVFEKFYRAHTGNLHNVKGFGLGLSYVKAIVDAHGGRVRVESAVGKGSTFTVLLPLEEGRG